MQIGKYPEAMYRVSLKAIIQNSDSHVLVVKEKGSAWSLPGGGLDHGESIDAALRRELYEETLITDSFTSQLIGADSFYVENKKRWQLWLVYRIALPRNFTYGVGADADVVTFIDPEALNASPHRSERLVCKWSKKNRLHGFTSVP